MISKVDLVIFHSPCFDGAAGCWVVESWCKDKKLSSPERFGCRPGQESYDFPKMEGKSVIIIDICFDRNVMIQMNNICTELVVLDHHKTSKEKMEGLDFAIFDMDRSGCQMAYDYFFPEYHNSRPHWINYIGDRDLWKWEFEETKPFNTALFNRYGGLSEDETVDAMWKIYELWSEDCKMDEFIKYGKSCLELQQKQINTACKYAIKCKMLTSNTGDEYTVWVSDSRLHISEIGAALARREDCDFALIYAYNLPKDEWWISLRSKSAEKADVGKIAASFPNGGGHACAAGFTWKISIQRLLTPIKS